jgi:rod shape-determining protein MreC
VSLRKLIKTKYLYIAFGLFLIFELTIAEQKQYLNVTRSYFLDIVINSVHFLESSSRTVFKTFLSIFDYEYKYKDLIKKTQKEAFFWKLEADRLRSELDVIRKVLDFKSDVHFKHIAAQMVVLQGALEQSEKAYLTIGKNSGVKKDNIVISTAGLIGKIIEVSNTTSEVLLMTNAKMAVPVTIVGTETVGIASGDGQGNIKLLYVDNTSVKDGEVVVTSGHGGLYPRGIRVGVISKDSEEDMLYITPFQAFEQDYYVYLVDATLEEK